MPFAINFDLARRVGKALKLEGHTTDDEGPPDNNDVIAAYVTCAPDVDALADLLDPDPKTARPAWAKVDWPRNGEWGAVADFGQDYNDQTAVICVGVVLWRSDEPPGVAATAWVEQVKVVRDITGSRGPDEISDPDARVTR